MRRITPFEREPSAGDGAPNAVVNSRYTVSNFLFKNLYEQFSRPLNFYFLLVAMLQFVSVIAPVSPLSTFLPLVFAFSLTAIKEGFDDVKRHRQDAAYNALPRRVLDCQSLSWVTRPNAEIAVGDVLLLSEGEDIPCDIVAVAAAKHQPHVFIRTDNFDGEVDLKSRDVVQPPHGSAQALSIDEPLAAIVSKLQRLNLLCPPPSSIMEAFDGRATFLCDSPQDARMRGQPTEATTDVAVPLNHLHLLPQSTVLKNTESIIAVAVYTGDATKCGMNKHPAPVKWAKIDKDVSFFSIVIFCCQMVNAVCFGLFGYIMNRSAPTQFWYLPEPRAEQGAKALAIYPLRFFLLTTVMIPVSFKFVVDMSKYYMAMTVDWDASMSPLGGDGQSGTGARVQLPATRVKNSSILEDLGQIDYVLSDKTGTMTANEMELLFVSVKPQRKVSLHDPALSTVRDASTQLTWLACAMALCNTVEVSVVGGHVQSGHVPRSTPVAAATAASPLLSSVSYQGASPDEVALCQGASALGVTLCDRQDALVCLRHSGREQTTEIWHVHHVFMFTSERKTMGVIVENTATGSIHFFLKGADDRVRKVLDRSETADNAVLEEHLREYAAQGLRTLLVAERRLSAEELASFTAEQREAELAVGDRQARLDHVRQRMEQNLHLIGITAIEDKLQDRVSSTIQDLLRAGVKVWMLTGDKVETAEQIGLSCGLYDPGDTVIRIVETDLYTGASPELARDEWTQTLLAHAAQPHRARDEAGDDLSHSERIHAWLSVGRDSERNVRLFGSQPDVDAESRVPLSLPAATRVTSAQRCVLLVQGGHVLDAILTTPHLRDAFAQVSSRCVSVICARSTPSQKASVTRFVRSLGAMTLAIGDGGNDVAMLQEAHVGVGIVGKEGQQAARAADFCVAQFSDIHALVFVHGQQAYARTAYVIKYSFYKSMLISFIQLAYNMVGTHYSGGTYWNSFSLTMWNGFFTLPHTLLYCLDRCAPRVVLERNPALYKLTRRSMDMRPAEFFGVFVLKGVAQSLVLLWLSSHLFGAAFADPRDGGAGTHDVAFSVSYTALMLSQAVTVYLDSHSVTLWNVVALVGMPLFYLLSTKWFSDVPTVQYFGVLSRTLHVEVWFAVIAETLILTLPFFITHAIMAALWPNPRDTLRRAELRRQLQLMHYVLYRRVQSVLVRRFGATPESASVFSLSPDAEEAAALDVSATHAV